MKMTTKQPHPFLTQPKRRVAWLSWVFAFACSSNPEPLPGSEPSKIPDAPAPSHWAFGKPAEVAPPDAAGLSNPAWVRNGIDALVLEQLDALGLSPAATAKPEALLRRVSLALTGLPPSIEQLDKFTADPTDAAYEALIDEMLASTRYAEHMASAWLDLARYADTDGYQYDLERPAWQWRDWVLSAIDANMPYDQFTTMQLAGDLLPNPTPEAHLATSFNRNHAIQDENGVVLNEYRDMYVADRVETVGRVWLGLTLGCARCHDHKYDPTTAKDFFSLYDCFNQVDEKDGGFWSEYVPTKPLESPLKASVLADVEARINALAAEPDSAARVAELEWDKARIEPTPNVRVMTDMPTKRPTQVLAGGRYDAPNGPQVTCSAPTFLPPFPAGAPQNRWGLAQWLMMPDNPLSHRVTVNRIWGQFFGSGLVPEVDNFGVLTAVPEHQKLLDWLGQEFVRLGFDVKAFHKLLVMSATFRQSSAASEAAVAADPSNRRLARGPRYRLTAEVIRDMPLAVSGLLVERFGGPPAYPYQPAGLWEALGWQEVPLTYPVMTGDALYRRSLYSYWKRTLPPIFLTIFDAPSRELSTAYRTSDTSPQQALALLNDPTVIQAARTISNQLWAKYPDDVNGAIGEGFRRITSRFPSEAELASLSSLYTGQLGPTPSQDFGIGAVSASAEQVFALAQVMRVVFNLAETITLE